MSLPDYMEVRRRIETVKVKDVKDLEMQMFLKALYLLGARVSEMTGEVYETEKDFHPPYGPTGDDASEGEIYVPKLQRNVRAIFFTIKTVKTKRPRPPVDKLPTRTVALPKEKQYETWTEKLYDYFKKAGSERVFRIERQKALGWLRQRKLFAGLYHQVKARKEASGRMVPEHPNRLTMDSLCEFRIAELEQKFGFEDKDLVAYGIQKMKKTRELAQQLQNDEQARKRYFAKLCKVTPESGIQEKAILDDSPLLRPSEGAIREAISKIKELLIVDDSTILEIVSNLLSGMNVILTGPVGTGKTHIAKLIPEFIWKEHGGYYPMVVTATADWTTQDVIGGIFPKINDAGDVTYAIQKGCIYDALSKNLRIEKPGLFRRNSFQKEKNTYRGVWVVIDEFNRANIDRAFGEMFTSIEHGNLSTDKQRRYII